VRIAVASDHGGFDLKTRIISFLKQRNISVEDLGNQGAESVDYPDYAVKVAEKVSKGEVDAGLLMCGTGIGMCIAANKFKGVRAAVVSEAYLATMAKEHNNANVLCLGGRVLDAQKDAEQAIKIVAAWLDASFEGGRHNRRLDKIAEIEKRNFR
jgi:ribose 5-phosphate isomerase B